MAEVPVPQIQLSPEDEAIIRNNLAPLQDGMMRAMAHNLIDTEFQKLMEARKHDPQLAARIVTLTDEFCRLYGVDNADIAHLF